MIIIEGMDWEITAQILTAELSKLVAAMSHYKLCAFAGKSSAEIEKLERRGVQCDCILSRPRQILRDLGELNPAPEITKVSEQQLPEWVKES